MKKFNQKEKKNRSLVFKAEDTRIILKSITRNINLANLTRWNAVLKLAMLSNKGAKNRLVNRCIFTAEKGGLLLLINSHVWFLKIVTFGKYLWIYKI